MPYSPRMSPTLRLFAMLTLLSWLNVCFAQKTAQPLSFSSEDTKVTDFVQLPQGILALLLNDKEDFPR